jgi:small subunit ribosomal protein S26e
MRMVINSLCKITLKVVLLLPIKRKSRGRSKGSKGRSDLVQCSSCGGLVPSDKAKKVSRPVTLVEPVLARELRQKGTYLPTHFQTKIYCVSCAVHRGVVKVRAKDDRRVPHRAFY